MEMWIEKRERQELVLHPAAGPRETHSTPSSIIPQLFYSPLTTTKNIRTCYKKFYSLLIFSYELNLLAFISGLQNISMYISVKRK